MANNTGKIIGGIIISAATIAAAYFGFFYKLEDGLTAWQQLTKKKPKEEPPKTDPTTVETNTSGGTGTSPREPLPSGGFPIAKGDKNVMVVRLQKALKTTWKQTAIGKADGDFGSKTETALKATGYGTSVADNDTLVKIEMGQKPSNATATTVPSEIKFGTVVYASKNMVPAYTKPMIGGDSISKKSFMQYDKIGQYDSASVIGWAKVNVSGFGNLFVPTNGITTTKIL